MKKVNNTNVVFYLSPFCLEFNTEPRIELSYDSPSTDAKIEVIIVDKGVYILACSRLKRDIQRIRILSIRIFWT